MSHGVVANQRGGEAEVADDRVQGGGSEGDGQAENEFGAWRRLDGPDDGPGAG